MLRTATIGLLMLPVVAAWSQAAAPPARPDPRGADVRPVVAGNTRFACDLYARLRDKPGNLILSPFSVSSALALTSAGARGKTLAEMEKTLHLPAQKQLHPGMRQLFKQLGATEGIELNVANALWAQKGKRFTADFRGLVKADYDAGAFEVDFTGAPDRSREQINKWVQKQTKNQIRNLIPSDLIKDDTRLILTNAIYFKGGWALPFPADNTAVKPFQVSKDRTRDVWLMKQRDSFRYHGQKEFQAVELPYAGGDVSLVVLLPRKAENLADVEKLLTPDLLARLGRNMTKQRVEVFLPRFKLTADVSLGKHLRSMGMVLAFSDGADLSGLDGGDEKLALNEVVHKAFIDVHEKGSEAGAGSGSVAGSRSVEFVPVFRADHPFVFLIRDNRSGSVLFLGRLSDPVPVR
jgi:serpin B